MTTKILSDYLGYDPKIGRLIWIKAPSNVIKIFSEAGAIDTDGYRQIKFDGKVYPASHVAWFLSYGVWPIGIDHKNRNRDDNRLDNLRECTHQENCLNRDRKLPSSGFRGVTKHNSGWKARVTFQGVTEDLGTFTTPELASEAYQKRAKELHKEYFPDA